MRLPWSMSKDDYLQVVRIAAAHHKEIVELAVSDRIDMSADIVDAGDQLDVAIVLAHLEGASLMDLWKATKLDVKYLAALTTGIFEP